MKTPVKLAAYALGALLLVGVVGTGLLLAFDGDRLKELAASKASEAAGRRVEIHGGLSFDPWSWTPQAHARDIVIQNLAWGSRPDMARIAEADVRIRLKPMFLGRLEIESLRLVRPDVLLESNGEEANWNFGAPEDEDDLAEQRADFPVVHRLVVEGGRFGYRSPQRDEPIDVEIERLEMKTVGFEQPVELAGNGRYKGEPIELQGRLAPFRQLRDESRPYEVDLQGRIGKTRLAVGGGIRGPEGYSRIQIDIKTEGQTLAEFHEWFDLPLPETGPYALSGILEQQGETWSLRGLQARLGDSEMHGDIRFLAGQTPLRVEGDLKSDKIVLKDLAPFLGGEDETTRKPGPGTGKSPPDKAAKNARLLSDVPFSLEKLPRMNADIRFAGKAVSEGALDVRNIEAHLKLDGGKLIFEPLAFGLARGQVRLRLNFDTSPQPPTLAAGVDVSGIDLNALLSMIGVDSKSAGLVRGKVDIETRGRSQHELAANAAGGGILVMEGGRIENLLLEAIALDLQEAIGQWASGDKSMARINCLAMPMPIRNGQLIADPWLFDTSDALVEIRGVVDLRSETVDVTLKPYPKDFSLFNSLTSITIKGDLAKRTASVNALEAAGKLALKTLAAPLMTVLSGQIEKEAKERTPCGRLAGEFGAMPGEDNPERNSQREKGIKP